MEEVSTTSKLPWIIGGVVALIILIGVGAVIFNSSSNKTEKSSEANTIGEILDSCMQTCNQLPSGSTKTNCEAGCTQAKQTVPTEFENAGISGAEDMTTDEVLQEIIARCITRCETDPEIPEPYKPACIENCKSVQ